MLAGNQGRWSVLLAAIAAITITTSASAQKAATGLPTDAEFQSAMQRAYSANKAVTEGKNADYIPALAKVDPKLFGIAILTVDGKVYSVGDTDHAFSIQSISKPFTAARLMSEMGVQKMEDKLGVNATGLPFNSIEAIERNKQQEEPPTGNPLVNAGAIATVGNLKAANADARWNSVINNLSAFAGRNLSVDQQIYKSEAETNTRNRSIADLLKAYEVIPGSPAEALDVYTRQCSVAVNVKDLAAMGATLATGGTNPLTGKTVVSPDVAAHTLAVMMTAGLYEDSGTWAYDVGVPAKSGVGGGIVAVVPGKYAVAAFAPPLDEAGNSVRSQRAIESIVKDLGGNVFHVAKRPAARPSPR
ncbi:glutaminase [Corallococcus sp. AB030]|uniref:glutaminase A n=1 Tax=Corallococcus sp. AB030 TaxID=2316716 RepID=UPI000EE8DBF2|nr:glutaminase A [Corallococcus sp. AB030]RKI15828.1 glutaminase [Corallococcus sp. AB030]